MQPYTIKPLLEEEAARPPSRWKQRLAWTVGTVIVLLLAGWFYVTSEHFLRTVILARAGEAIHARIDYESADWSFRRSLTLRGVRLTPEGEKPCLAVKEFRVRYQLGDLLDGRPLLQELTLIEPKFTVHMEANGRTNLDPLFQKKKESKSKKTRPTVRVDQLTVQGGEIQFTREYTTGTKEFIGLTALEVQGNEIGNAGDSQLNLAAGVRYTLQRAGVVTADDLRGTLVLESSQTLGPRWRPQKLVTQVKTTIAEASGQFQFAKGLEAGVDTRLTPAQLEQFSVQFLRGPDALGKLKVSGPMDFTAGIADLDVTLEGIDRAVLNFVGRPHELDFHGTVLNATNRLLLRDFGQSIVLNGHIAAQPLHLSRGGTPFPALDAADARYELGVSFTDKKADLQSLMLNLRHRERPFMNGTLEPTTLVWGAATGADVPESRFQLTLAETNLAEWRAWVGRFAHAGTASGQLTVKVAEAGRRIGFEASAQVDDLRVPRQNQIQTVGPCDLNATAELVNYRKLNFTQLQARVGNATTPAMLLTASETMADLQTRTLSGKARLDGDLPMLMTWFPVPNLSVGTGRATADGAFKTSWGAEAAHSFAGKLDWGSVTGRAPGVAFTKFDGHADANMTLTKGQLMVRQFNAKGTLNGKELAAQLFANGRINSRTGQAHLAQLVVRELDVAALKQAVAIEGLNGGELELRATDVVHLPGQRTTGKVDSMQLRHGVVPGWPTDLNLKAAGQTELTWLEGGRFELRARALTAGLLNRTDPRRLDADLRGEFFWNNRTGAWQAILAQSEWHRDFWQPLTSRYLGNVTLTEAKASHARPLQFGRDAQGTFAVRGPVTIDRLRLDSNNTRLPRARLGGEAVVDVRWWQRDGQWRVDANQTSIKLLRDGQPAGQVTVEGQYQSAPRAASFALQAEAVQREWLALLPPQWLSGVEVRGGRLERLQSEGTLTGNQLAGKASWLVKGLQLREPSGRWPAAALDVEQSLEGAWKLGEGFAGNIKTNTGKLTDANGTVVLNYDVHGEWNEAAKRVVVRRLEAASMAGQWLVDRWLPGRGVRAGTLRFAPETVYVHGERFNGSVQLAGFTVRDRSGVERKLDSRFDIDARAVDQVFHITKFTAHLPPSARAENTATIAGRVDLSKPGRVAGKLVLHADALDITPLMDLLFAKAAAAPKPGSSPAAAPVSAVAPFDNLAIGLDVQKLFWRDINATGLRGEVVLDKGAVKLAPLEMRLLGASAMADGWIIPRGRNTAFSLLINCQKLPLNPIARHFHPDLHFDLGLATFRTHASAEAIADANFSRTLAIRGVDTESAELTITRAKMGRKPDAKPAPQPPTPKPVAPWDPLQLLSTLGAPIPTIEGLSGGVVGIMSEVFPFEDLSGAFISDLRLKLHVRQAAVSYDLMARGHLIGFDSAGQIRLASNWKESKLNQSIDLLLIGSLAKKLRVTGGLLLEDDQYYSILNNGKVAGTLAEPKPDKLGLLQKSQLGTLRVLGEPARLLDNLLHLRNPVPDAINPFNLLKHLFPPEPDEEDED